MNVRGITASEVVKQGCGLVCFGLALYEMYEFSNKYSDKKQSIPLKNFCFDYSVTLGYALTGATTPFGIKIISFVAHKILSKITFNKINPTLSSFEVGGVSHIVGSLGVLLVLPLIFKDLFVDKDIEVTAIHTFCNICITPISLYYAPLVWKNVIFKA